MSGQTDRQTDVFGLSQSSISENLAAITAITAVEVKKLTIKLAAYF